MLDDRGGFGRQCGEVNNYGAVASGRLSIGTGSYRVVG